MGRPNKKNTIISVDGEMGSIEIIVHYQGSRGVIREDYDDYEKFLDRWCSIPEFWERQKKAKPKEIKFNSEARARIDAWLNSINW